MPPRRARWIARSGITTTLKQQNQRWAGVQSLIMVESRREIIGRHNSGAASVERRYYLSSLTAKAAHLAHTVRTHLKNEKSTKVGIATKRLKAGWSAD